MYIIAIFWFTCLCFYLAPFQINVTARDVQLVGTSLILDCSIRDLGGETNSLEIIWISDNTILQRTNVTKIEDYKDSYNISLLTTSDQNRIIQCMARSFTPLILDGSNIMLNITGRFILKKMYMCVYTKLKAFH